MILHIFLLFSCIQCLWCFTIDISGDTYIESGVLYIVTCTVSHFLDDRRTIYNAKISITDQLDFSIFHSKSFGCLYRVPGEYTLCQSSVCSCDVDGLATHWTYNTSADLSSPVTFRCSSKNNDGYLETSKPWTPTIPYGPGSSISVSPSEGSFTKIQGQSLGPIVCSAQCDPPCQFYWIKADGTVVAGSHLEIPSLMKSDHGTFTCHAGNGYGNNATKNIFLTVNFEPLLNVDIPSSHEIIGLQNGTSLNITVSLLANPAPTIQWIFRKNDSIDNIIKSYIRSNGFEFTSNIFIQEINKTQFGSYIVFARNNIGSFNRRFSVNEKDHPIVPSVFYVVCQTTSAVVLWRSEFNGGSKQEFYVQYWRISLSSQAIVSPSILDPGLTSDLQYTVNNLVPETLYIFHIIARNVLGDSFTKSVNCTTDQRQTQTNPVTTSQDNNGLFVAGISSLVLALITTIFVISLLVFCRFRLKKKERMRSKDYTEFKTCTKCNPVAKENYDTLNTTTIGTIEESESPIDMNYEECQSSVKTDQPSQQISKRAEDIEDKKGDIYDNIEA